MKDVDLVVSGGRIYTLDEDRTVYTNGGLAIDKTGIVAVGTRDEITAAYRGRQTLDGSGHMITPGLIDTHMHPGFTLTRAHLKEPPKFFVMAKSSGRSAEAAPHVYDKDLSPSPHSTAAHQPNSENLFPFYAQLGMMDMLPPVLSYALARHSLLIALKHGATMFVDGGGGHPDGIAEAALSLGMRAGVSASVFDSLVDARAIEKGPQRQRDVDQQLDMAHAAVTRWHGAGEGMIDGWYNFVTDVTSSDALITGIAELAKEHNRPITSHTAAAYSQEHYSVQYFKKNSITRIAELGVLDAHWLGVHMGFFEDHELALLVEHQANIAHCTGTSSLEGKGILKFGKILDAMLAGVTVGLATDTTEYRGMVDELRRVTTGYREINADSRVMPGYTALELATRNAAKCVNRDDIGRLKAGMKADFIMIDIDQPHYEMMDPLRVFTTIADGADIRTSVINGQVVMKDRELVVADEDTIRRDARAAVALVNQLTGRG